MGPAGRGRAIDVSVPEDIGCLTIVRERDIAHN
jgi:hypothetical protein